jgi:hypothetical protein
VILLNIKIHSLANVGRALPDRLCQIDVMVGSAHPAKTENKICPQMNANERK